MQFFQFITLVLTLIPIFLFIKFKNKFLWDLGKVGAYLYLLILNPLISFFLAIIPTMFWQATIIGEENTAGITELLPKSSQFNPNTSSVFYYNFLLVIPYLVIALMTSLVVKSNVWLKLVSALIGPLIYYFLLSTSFR